MEIKERIIEEAAKLFRMYGIRSVTMDTLAGQLGISKRTIYEIFSDKDELLIGVLQTMARRQKALIENVLSGSESAIHAIFRLLEASIDHFQTVSPAFQADLKKYHYEVLMKECENCEMPDYKANIEIIMRGIREKLFRMDVHPEIANRCLYSLVRMTLDFDLFPAGEFTRRDVIKNAFINYMRGISTPEGLRLINQLEVKF